jgi:hypothetical protein
MPNLLEHSSFSRAANELSRTRTPAHFAIYNKDRIAAVVAPELNETRNSTVSPTNSRTYHCVIIPSQANNTVVIAL